MIWKTIILLSFALCVFGDGHHAISEQRIKVIHKEQAKEHRGHHGELAHIGSKKPEHHEEYAWSYPSYEFSYKVHDPHTHDLKGQQESREGDEVKGEYWLVQPDGRKRTVSYHADKHSGFHATVHYSDGEKHEYEVEEPSEEGVGGEGAKEGGEEGGEAEGAEEGNEEAAAGEEEGEEGRGAEESRGREEEIGRWIHDRYWGHRADEKLRDERRRDEAKQGLIKIWVEADRKRKEENKNLGGLAIYGGLGSYARRDNRDRAEWHGHDSWRSKDEGLEENRNRKGPHEFAERRAYPTYKTGAIVRENYYHPRFYRHNQHQRRDTRQ